MTWHTLDITLCRVKIKSMLCVMLCYVLYPVFLARNRMMTRVVAKQAKATKVKNKFVNGKKSSKEYSVVFLVEGKKFNLSKEN